MRVFTINKSSAPTILGSIGVSIPACQAGGRSSAPRRGETNASVLFYLSQNTKSFAGTILFVNFKCNRNRPFPYVSNSL